jgi:hypothetical protein
MSDVLSRIEVESPFEFPPEQVTQRDQWFEPWLCAKGGGLQSLVEIMHSNMLFHEKQTNQRVRARKTADAETFRSTLEALIANLARASFLPEGSRQVAISFRKARTRTRYENQALSTRMLRDLVRMLQELDAVDLQIGSYGKQRLSTVAPTTWFGNRVRDHKVSLDDFARSQYEEIIILKRKERGEEDSWSFDNTGKYEEYNDTPQTMKCREELKTLNEFLADADARFLDDGLEPMVNTSDRTLRRYFTVLKGQRQRFDQAGRVFGGWWLNLKSSRRANILIQGEAPADLDFASMFARLAYAEVGQEAPAGDLYDLSGYLHGYDRTKGAHRKGVKTFFNSMLFGGGMGSSVPKGTRSMFPREATAEQIRGAIKAKHSALSPLFGTNVGYKLMFRESEVLLRALELLRLKDIVALPLHDGLMVAKTATAIASEAMITASLEVTGFSLPVEVKS